MWLYRKAVDHPGYDVGFLQFDSQTNMPTYSTFLAIEAYLSVEDARDAVNYLNGGNQEVRVNGTVDIGTTGL